MPSGPVLHAAQREMMINGRRPRLPLAPLPASAGGGHLFGVVMSTKYPQYRIGQWIDTSEEAMNKPQATILYGVQIKPEKASGWMHVARGSEPMIFDSLEKASAAIAELKA